VNIMATVDNIVDTVGTVILDENMWMGSLDSSTNWLSGITGRSIAGVQANKQADKGVSLMIIDVEAAAQNTASTIAVKTSEIPGIKGAIQTVVAVLAISNVETITKQPTNVGHSDSKISFTTHATSGANQTHRIAFLYL
jgi:hypothetical protein